MNYYDRILKIAERNNGYVTTNEIVKKGINKMFLTNMVKKGTLVKLERGYYGLPNYIEDPYYKIALKSKSVRFSGPTALYLHNFSDRNPLVYHISLPNNYGGVLQKDKNLAIHFVKKELLDLGVMEMNSPFGMKIKVYDMERTICDMIKNKNKMDMEIFSKALKEYTNSKDKNIRKLRKYAQTMKIEERVREYMEVLL